MTAHAPSPDSAPPERPTAEGPPAGSPDEGPAPVWGARLTPLAAALPATVPFVGPETQERRMGRAFAARLGANENGFGPSPAALAAMRAAAGDAWMYADPENHDLRSALAAHHGVTPAHVVVAEGIDALLGYLVRLTVGPGDAVVTSAGAYPTFNFHVAGYGGRLHTVPYAGNHEDPDALLARAAAAGARLVYLSNPDNPMGSWHDGARVAAMVEGLRPGALLVLDEAYVDLAPPGTAADLDADDPRVIRLRTFSKAHGMAGARAGYAIGAPALIGAFDRVRNHFGMSRIAQAGALAALADEGWLVHVRGLVGAARDRIGRIARANRLQPLPSATNFVAIDCGQDGDFARRVLAGLTAQGIFARMPSVAPLDRCIRISAGPDAALDLFEAALPEALASARG